MMRFLVPVTVVTFALMLCLAAPLAAKGGKGGGKGGHSKPSGGSHGAKFSQPAGHGHKGGVKTDKHPLAETDKKPPKEKHEKPGKHQAGNSDPEGADGDAGEPTEVNKKQKQLANFQRQRDKKLAQAEHLRQIAERNGNTNLAANADRMEAQAHEQYAKKVAHLEKFGVTDPELNPGGGVTDPLVPGGDPLFPVGTH
jgi:hypothetical protein